MTTQACEWCGKAIERLTMPPDGPQWVAAKGRGSDCEASEDGCHCPPDETGRSVVEGLEVAVASARAHLEAGLPARGGHGTTGVLASLIAAVDAFLLAEK